MQMVAQLTLRVLSVIAAIVAIWQALGLVPVIGWLGEPSQITPGMVIFGALKCVWLGLFATIWYFTNRAATRIKARRVEADWQRKMNKPDRT